MQDAQAPIKAVHDFLEGIDWEMLEEAAGYGGVALRFVQRHPWILVAGGVLLSAVGAWQMVSKDKDEPSGSLASRRYSQSDLMAP